MDARTPRPRAAALDAAVDRVRRDPFRPPRWMRSPHAQTLIGSIHLGRVAAGERWVVPSEAGTRLVCHAHLGPRPGDAGALVVVHGMGGSSASTQVLSIMAHARQHGLQVVRMNMRNCGGTEAMTPSLYHGNLSVDVDAVVGEVVRRGVRRVVIAGYSMGGNLVLNTLARWGTTAPKEVVGAVVVCPAMDVARCVERLEAPGNEVYHRYFAGLMRGLYERKAALFPERFDRARAGAMRTIRAFDRLGTGPDVGIHDVEALYAWLSSSGRLAQVSVPALVIHAVDDPIVELLPSTRAAIVEHPALALVETPFGGHCGFRELPSRRRPDGRWAAAKIAEVAALWTG